MKKGVLVVVVVGGRHGKRFLYMIDYRGTKLYKRPPTSKRGQEDLKETLASPRQSASHFCKFSGKIGNFCQFSGKIGNFCQFSGKIGNYCQFSGKIGIYQHTQAHSMREFLIHWSRSVSPRADKKIGNVCQIQSLTEHPIQMARKDRHDFWGHHWENKQDKTARKVHRANNSIDATNGGAKKFDLNSFIINVG